MKYLNLQITNESQGLLYRRDIDVADAFSTFVRCVVGKLVRNGIIHRGEHYSAVIVPRYGRTLLQSPLILVNSSAQHEQAKWIDMKFEEPVQPDKPVQFFTLELVVQERPLIYRRDFQVSEVAYDYVQQGLETALLNIGVLRVGDLYNSTYLARDDDAADFDREHIPSLERDASSLVELLPDAERLPAFQYRNPAAYEPTRVVGNPTPSDHRIYVSRSALSRLMTEGRLSVAAERGGMLVGHVYQSTVDGKYLIEAKDLIISEHTSSSVTELRYTFESWRGHMALMRDRFPGLIVVGWFHTHLVEIPVVTAGQPVRQTSMFFSQDDHFLHRTFFPDKWYVAMVLDPKENSIFFQWEDNEIVACGGYYVYDDSGVAGA